MLVVSTSKLTPDLEDYLVRTYPSVTFEFFDHIDDAIGRLPETDILITYGEDLIAEHINIASKLKWIMVISAGLELMPLVEIKQKNIIVTNARGIHKVPMAEHVISMLLQVYRKADILMNNQKRHHWDRKVPVQEISNRTMTIIGAGAIGQEVARLAKAFNMKTIDVSNSGTPKTNFDQMYHSEELEKSLPNADFVISILPSTTETTNFFTEKHFEMMPNHAVFMNIGRGDVVKSEVLLNALDHNEIAHVILDVFEQEPLPYEHPFWEHERVTLTPHLSSKSSNYLPRAIDIFEENLSKFMENGKDLTNLIDLDRGY